MKKHPLRGRIALVALAVSAALALPGLLGASGRASAEPRAVECEGDACAQVTLTFDEAKGQYRAANTTADRWVRVSAANQAASASACLAPGKEAYLPLKSVVAPYRAAFAEARCGAPEGVGR